MSYEQYALDGLIFIIGCLIAIIAVPRLSFVLGSAGFTVFAYWIWDWANNVEDKQTVVKVVEPNKASQMNTPEGLLMKNKSSQLTPAELSLPAQKDGVTRSKAPMKIMTAITNALVRPYDRYYGFNKPLSDLINRHASIPALENLKVTDVKGKFRSSDYYSDYLDISYDNGARYVSLSYTLLANRNNIVIGGPNAFLSSITRIKRTNTGEWKFYLNKLAKDVYAPNDIIDSFPEGIELIIATIKKDQLVKDEKRAKNQVMHSEKQVRGNAWLEFEKSNNVGACQSSDHSA